MKIINHRTPAHTHTRYATIVVKMNVNPSKDGNYIYLHTYRRTHIRMYIHTHTHTGFFKVKLLKRHGTRRKKGFTDLHRIINTDSITPSQGLG